MLLNPPPPSPSTIITRYGVDYCTLCALAVDFCRCGTTPAEDEAARDGAAKKAGKP